MTPLAARLLTLLLLQASPAPPPVFSVGVERTRVEVLVTRGGRPVPGLSAADFELHDSGVLQDLEPVLHEATPVDTVLVLDRSLTVEGPKLAALREAAGAYLDQLRSGERAALIAFANEVALAQPLTADLQRVRAAVARGPAGGATALSDAVYAGLRLCEPASRRTAVVVFSDGLENASWLRRGQLVEAARRSDAIVYGVLAGAGDDRDPTLFRELAAATGGRVFESRGLHQLRARFLEVLEDIRSRYVLSYTPHGVERAGWHPLSVRLRRGRADVLARPGYWRSGE